MAPRGIIAHEFLNLPLFWLRMWRQEEPAVGGQRIPYGPHSRQYFLFFQPPGETPRRRTAVLYMHGGGWRFGSPEAFTPHAKVFLDAGFPVMILSVRRIPFFSFDDMREDLNLFLQRLRRLWRQYGWEGRRFVVGGMSSGGHLATHLAFDHQALQHNGWSSSDIGGLFCAGAPLDLDQMPLTPVVRAMAGARHAGQYHRANPTRLIRKTGLPPTLLLHGTRDGLVPIDSTRAFAERMAGSPDVSLQFHVIPDGTHLDAASWGHTDNEERRVILEWMDRFG